MPVSGVDPRYRFLARFGATILSGGIAAIPMALYHYQSELALIPQVVRWIHPRPPLDGGASVPEPASHEPSHGRERADASPL